MCYELLVPTSKRRKKHIQALFGNKSIYKLTMGRWSRMGSSTLIKEILVEDGFYLTPKGQRVFGGEIVQNYQFLMHCPKSKTKFFFSEF